MSRQTYLPSKPTPSFTGQRALILHRPHATVDAIIRQLTQLGMAGECFWPDLPRDLDAGLYHAIFFDADLGYDAQFSWGAGECPMPAIAHAPSTAGADSRNGARMSCQPGTSSAASANGPGTVVAPTRMAGPSASR